MLFNSFAFLLIFLPLVFAGYRLLSRWPAAALCWLAAASLVFYSWDQSSYLWLLLGSVAFNYLAGCWLLGLAGNGRNARPALLLCIGCDLALLCYYKYANWLGLGHGIMLPLGISFFTFTQIAYLVDTARGQVRETRPLHYLLFVTYFPHLIAGPILHHREMMPQFARGLTVRLQPRMVMTGLALFGIGLVKKVWLADSFIPYVTPIFEAASHGKAVGMLPAWQGALAYTLQIYFDFSAYTDMAIGISRLFGIRLPFNFFSPYKAPDMIAFWRRWHMTLSRFLRDYLYIPLGGNRHGALRRYGNLLATMLLGGLWHGAGWGYLAWGGLHGLFLIVNHAWRRQSTRLPRIMATAVTFLAVVVAWVPFRAENLGAALAIWRNMGVGDWHKDADGAGWLYIALGLGVCWLMPNSLEWLRLGRMGSKPRGAIWRRLAWRQSYGWAFATAALLALGIVRFGAPSEFIYFQF